MAKLCYIMSITQVTTIHMKRHTNLYNEIEKPRSYCKPAIIVAVIVLVMFVAIVLTQVLNFMIIYADI